MGEVLTDLLPGAMGIPMSTLEVNSDCLREIFVLKSRSIKGGMEGEDKR